MVQYLVGTLAFTAMHGLCRPGIQSRLVAVGQLAFMWGTKSITKNTDDKGTQSLNFRIYSRR
eukprot:6156265-Amphidinium_carterae.1